MANTARHDFIIWSAGFTQSDTILNDLLLKLDTKLNASVVSASTAAEPTTGLAAGDTYILPASPTGTDWATFSSGNLAYWDGANWLEVVVVQGDQAHVDDTDDLMIYDGANWLAYANVGTETHIADPTGGTTVDSEARTAINAILDALEAHHIVATS